MHTHQISSRSAQPYPGSLSLTWINPDQFSLLQNLFDALSLTQIHSDSFANFGLIRNYSDSRICIRVHLYSFRFAQIRPVLLRFTQSLSDWRKLIQNYPISSRFTRSYSDHSSLAWIHSDSSCLTQIWSISLRFTQPHSNSYSFDADPVRSTRSCTNSVTPTQIYSDWFNVM